jgi:hypothetical protein
LRAFAGVVTQPAQNGYGCRRQRVGARHPRPQAESTVRVPGGEPVVLQRDCQPMDGRPGHTGACHQLGQRRRFRAYHIQDRHGLVQNADSAIMFHALILPSHILGFKDSQDDPG